MIELIISGRLPGMNEYISACRSSVYAGNTMKSESQKVIEWCIRKQQTWKAREPVFIKYTFFEPNEKRDQDNISGFAHKVIQDALVNRKILKNDGWKNIKGFSDEFFVDKENPRIEVKIYEEGELNE